MTRAIVIDADPGQDDAVAILMALASPEIDVLAVTTVAGNVPQPLVTNNALALVELAGTETPVYQGCVRPMLRDLYTAEYVHGPTGIDGADLPPPVSKAGDAHAVDYLIQVCLERDGVTLVPVGPLTNIAMAIVKEPTIVPRIREIVWMGGGFFEGGNTTPAAEFNAYVDPHAAQVVMSCDAPLTIFPLDVTHQALIMPDHLERFRALGTRAGDSVAGMLDFYERFDLAKYGTAGAPLHDPCTIAYLLDPGLFEGKKVHVEVETGSETTIGMTVMDWWEVTGQEANATVMCRVDGERFMDRVIAEISRFPLR